MAATNFDWDVLIDPERTFTGPFRWLDLIKSAHDGFWPEGIVFIHRQTGKTITYRDGQLLAVGQQQAQAIS